MGLKYLYKSNYFSRLADTYTDYGAWSESISGAGGLPSDESIELFLDSLISAGIEIVDQKMRVPQINLHHLFDKYSNKLSSGKSINYDDYDGFHACSVK
jgi:hypothetical protein